MAVRSKNAYWRMRDILRRHWLALGTRHGILTADGHDAERLIDRRNSGSSPGGHWQGGAQLPRGFDAQLANSIFEGMRAATGRLAG